MQFIVISGTLIGGGGDVTAEMQLAYSTAPSNSDIDDY